MEYRKIIGFGKSSFVLSLPKPWLEKNKLKKGDLVSVDSRENDLILSSKKEAESGSKQKEIIIDTNGKDIDHIKREIIPAYMHNYNTIIIKGKDLTSKAKEIRDILHNLMALEIMEQSSERIVAKDFLDMEKISIKNMIRKVDVIIREMIIDSKELLAQKDYDNSLYDNIVHRDDDINRLSYLIFRTIRFSLDNPIIEKKHNITVKDLVMWWRITEHLESLGDEIKVLCRHFQYLKKKQSKNLLLEYLDSVQSLYLETLKAIHNKNINIALAMGKKKNNLLNKFEKSFFAQENHLCMATEHIKNMVVAINKAGRALY